MLWWWCCGGGELLYKTKGGCNLEHAGKLEQGL